MRFTNLTRATEIGANSYLLEIGGKNVVLDSGLHPVREGEDSLPDFTPLEASPPDSILISHAHQDHVGSLPVFQRKFPDARVFLTEPTAEIAEAMLHNSVSVMMRKREETGLREYPLFTHRETERNTASWQLCALRRKYNLEGDRLGFDEHAEASFELFDAGHILGSASVLFREGDRTLFYTGDINLDDQTISQAADLPDYPVDVLVMEATRGDNPLKEGYTRQKEEERFCNAILEAAQAGQPVLVPVFALGKTQEILTLLHGLARRGKLQNAPVYIGGLSTRITTIYDRLAHQSRRKFPGLELLEVLAPYTITSKTLPEARLDRARIYALSAGMMTEHTLSYSLAKRMISREDCHIFFVGYADPESPAGKLKNARPGDLIQLGAGTEPQLLRCQIEKFDFSGHASREALHAMALKLRPKTILLVHGDAPAIAWFQETLGRDLPGTRIVVPPPGETIEI